MSKVRPASHAGSWYSSDPEELDSSLTQWLEAAQPHRHSAKAIICPHAGYEYSGATAAWAYRSIDPERVKRVLLLGPAHHEYISGCALPWANRYQTPLGDIPIDLEAIGSLQTTSAFSQLKARGEKDEHSLEMQLPYLRKVLRGVDFTLIPVIVGEVSPRQQDRFAELLLPYFEEENTVTVVSSDFCVSVTQHWGRDFDYTYYDSAAGERWQSIQALDRLGMDIIERGDVEYALDRAFRRYVSETGNTICGQHPISVLLSVRCIQIIGRSRLALETVFVKYAQSNKVVRERDTSVSYAAGVTSLLSNE